MENQSSSKLFLGIKFAPLWLPFHRRWETFCMAFVMTLGALMQPIVPLLLYLLYRLSPYLFLLYFCWMIYDWNTPTNGGRRSGYIRKMFVPVRNYFPAKIVKTADITPGRNYLFASFPHGVLSVGMASNFIVDANCIEAFPGIESRMIVLKSFFSFPFAREFLLSAGASASTEKNIMTLLRSEDKNKAVILMVGGALEALYANPGKTCTIILENRKGFVRLALKAGSPLVPLFTFGENEVYTQLQGEKWMKFQNSVRKWTGIPPILMNGRGFFQYSFGIFPQRVPLTTVVGRPIPIPQIDNPTKEDVDKYHALYKMELIHLFETHKEKYHSFGNEAELIII